MVVSVILDVITICKCLSPTVISGSSSNFNYACQSRLEGIDRHGIHQALRQAVVDMNRSIQRSKVKPPMVDDFLKESVERTIMKLRTKTGEGEGFNNEGMTLMENTLMYEPKNADSAP